MIEVKKGHITKVGEKATQASKASPVKNGNCQILFCFLLFPAALNNCYGL